MHPVLGLESQHRAPGVHHGRGAAGVILINVAAPCEEGVQSTEEGLLITQLTGLLTGHSRLFNTIF